MKRNNSLSTSLKGYTTYSPLTKNPTIKDSSYASFNSHSNNVSEDYMNGFPWPPRSYTCSFCRKEFKSAQALGGHMNVHRRDRARLRQSSPPTHHEVQIQGQGSMLNLNLNPTTTITTTTNPNFSTSSLTLLPSASPSSSSSCATTSKPVTCTTLPLFVSQTPPSPSFDLNRWVVVDGIVLSKKNSEPITKSSKIACDDIDECRMLEKKGEMLRMDLEIGLPRNHYDLDLELRLGTYSSSNGLIMVKRKN